MCIVPICAFLWKADGCRQSFGTMKLLTRLSVRIAYSTAVQKLFKTEKSKRGNNLAVIKRWRALADPQHFFGHPSRVIGRRGGRRHSPLSFRTFR